MDERRVFWQNSAAKKYLKECVANGTIPVDMPPREAFKLMPAEFLSYDSTYKKFTSRLRNLKNDLIDKKNRKKIDAAAFLHDRAIYPRPTKNAAGEPQWCDSLAGQLLKLDIKEGRHKALEPKLLYTTRPEFAPYSLENFRGHIYQEVRAGKFLLLLQTRKSKKMKWFGQIRGTNHKIGNNKLNIFF